MSELQIVLIVIGALIIVAVLLVNWWQEKRFHQQIANSFSPLDSDALLDDPRFDGHSTEAAVVADSLSAVATHDVASLEDNDFDDQNASFKPSSVQSGPTFIADISANDALTHAEFISEERYTTLADDTTQKSIQQLAEVEAETEIDQHPALPTETKPLQRDDIKAIFEEAFSNLNKTTVASAASRFVMHNIADNDIAADEDTLKPNSARQALQKVAPSLPAMLDAQIDLTALVYLATETAASALSSALLSLVEGHDKPMFVHLLDANQQWHLPSQINPDLAVIKVACSLQMADRSGALSRPALNRFQLAVDTFGAGLNASVEWQNTTDALTAANELDAFCIDVDKSIGFHLLHGENGPFTGTKLRGLAEAQGLALTTDGTFKYHNESSSAKPLAPADFVMFNRDDHLFSPEMLRASVVKSVSFQLDIPHVKQCSEVFNHMVQVARQMEIGLNATLVDDNNKALNELQVDKIRQQLKSIQSAMQLRGIVAGSDSALRLFS